jgi:hypothetical protein
MIEHFALRFGGAYHHFRAQMEILLHLEKEDRGKPLNDSILSEGRKEFIANIALRGMIVELEHMEFPTELSNKAKRLLGRLVGKDGRTWTAASLLDALTDLNGDISRELDKHKYFQVRVGGEQYVDNENLFGGEVSEKFTGAKVEIKDAGNCFATELYTATVYHLMRVAEHGLRQIARRLKVTLTDKNKPVPIEYGDWQTVIEAIKNKISTARKLPRGPKKDSQLTYYSDLADRCEYLKDLYRNPAAHTRKRYNEGEALGVMERVRGFMQALARTIPK